jgi:hypothetical protein
MSGVSTTAGRRVSQARLTLLRPRLVKKPTTLVSALWSAFWGF